MKSKYKPAHKLADGGKIGLTEKIVQSTMRAMGAKGAKMIDRADAEMREAAGGSKNEPTFQQKVLNQRMGEEK